MAEAADQCKFEHLLHLSPEGRTLDMPGLEPWAIHFYGPHFMSFNIFQRISSFS